MTKQRVVHVGPAPEDVGGMETVLRVYRDAPWENLDVQVVSSKKREPGWRQLLTLFTAARGIHGIPTGIPVHMHLSQKGSFIREGILTLIASRRHPVYATIHGSSYVATAQHAKYKFLYRVVLNRFRAIAVLNEQALRTTRELAPHVRSLILPNPGAVWGDLPQRTSRSSTVVFAGAVGVRKGADVLAAAWPMVQSQFPQARLKVIGPIEPEFPRHARDQLAKHCVGPLAPQEVHAIMRDALCAVLPSRAEGQPMFLIEALGLGLPIVVTDVGGMPALANGTGVVLSENNPVQLANGILGLLGDPEKTDQLAAHALTVYARDFSISRHEMELVRLYSETNS